METVAVESSAVDTQGPIVHHAEVKLGDIAASLMIHRSGTRMLTLQRNSGSDGDRYVGFSLHLTEADVAALSNLLAAYAQAVR